MSNWNRFWDKVSIGCPNECWIWLAGSQKGYGIFAFNTNPGRKRRRSHRVAYELLYGMIPDGMVVCHKCDNPGCVNPAHLFIGTQKENCLDAQKKNRASKKLTPQTVREIRELRLKGLKYKEIALRYGVNRRLISMVCKNELWTHIV